MGSAALPTEDSTPQADSRCSGDVCVPTRNEQPLCHLTDTQGGGDAQKADQYLCGLFPPLNTGRRDGTERTKSIR